MANLERRTHASRHSLHSAVEDATIWAVLLALAAVVHLQVNDSAMASESRGQVYEGHATSTKNRGYIN